jgi:hypothetical protein
MSPSSASTLPLWRIAQTFINTLFNLFGAPEQIAADHTLTAKAHALLLSWLRVGEALIRRLLLIEAAALTPNTANATLGRRKTGRVRTLRYFYAEQPEKWRVSFRCIVSPKISNQEPRRKAERKGQPVRFYSAWPLAERAEALLRAYNDPAPYAQRLANALYRRPHRAKTLLAYPENAPARIGEEGFATLEATAALALKRIDPG